MTACCKTQPMETNPSPLTGTGLVRIDIDRPGNLKNGKPGRLWNQADSKPTYKLHSIYRTKGRIMKKIALSLTVLCLLANWIAAGELKHFITCDGGRLMDGNEEFRFISFNIPNLHYVEDDMKFDRRMPFRMPDDYEINDALETIKQMGGRVVRIYTLPVFKANEPADTPKYVLGPGKFDKEAFQTLDRVLTAANRHGIRIVIPIVNNFKWWGGAVDYAAFRGKEKNDFWTDPQLIEDFKKTVHFLVTRTNTITGTPYVEDKAILTWETGNETQCPHSWTREIAAYIKSLDSNHLVMDGYYTSVLRDESIADENIDIVQTHHYEKDPRDMIEHIKTSARKAVGRKPYMAGEFGFIGTEAIRAVLNTVIKENLSGALIWSLRYHHREGGFFWHSEPSGGDFFKAYHWPGFNSGQIYDEFNLMALMRAKAFEIQGLPVPPLKIPKAPVLLPIRKVTAISWQGSTGASGYDIERAEQKNGPWKRIAFNVSDAEYQYRPLFNDRTAVIGKKYFYRVRARNSAGVSSPGKIAGPIEADRLVLIDELENDAKIFFRSDKLSITHNEARKYKEDIHRLNGTKGDWLIYHLQAPIRDGKVYAFFSGQISDFLIEASPDGKQFVRVNTRKRDYSTGEGEYGYLKPVLFQTNSMPERTRYLKIEFGGRASISRIEIGYGQ